MNDFFCVTVSPIQVAHPGIAVASARAGAVAILDVERLASTDASSRGLASSRARENLRKLMQATPEGRPIGLRLHAGQINEHLDLIAALSGRPSWLILCGSQHTPIETPLASLLVSLPQSVGRRIWLEVLDVRDVSALKNTTGFDGFVAKGSESGGFVGDVSAFVLAQHLAKQHRPFLVQGGIGLHSAAACRAAGATGVVVDDQLLLLRESPLDEATRASLGRLSVTDTMIVGARLGAPVRIAARPNLRGSQALLACADEIERRGLPRAEGEALWRVEAARRMGFGDADIDAWPVGQMIGRAAAYTSRYRSVGHLVRAILDASEEHLCAATTAAALAPESPLARSHGTRYPIVQGPMTRVSDRAAFAASVAEGGALPLLALALMRREQVEPLLAETRERLGERPWGVGILGFVPPEIRQEQMEAIVVARPRFALIAGGRPDQSAMLEKHGIPTYLHAPTPSLLRIFLEHGARRFVFEGSECGGHVGPLTSFALWDAAVDELLEMAPSEASAVFVLFAGGIHDACSAAMVAALSAPLTARGVRVGVLMGTAYLFTAEIVASGAVVPAFQRQVLTRESVTTIETGPGHVIRCARTPFIDELQRVREGMLREGRPAVEISQALEDLTIGRARVASKGLERDGGGQLHALDDAQQVARGLYMLGDIAALRSFVLDIPSLHEDVSLGSARLLGDRKPQRSNTTPKEAAPAQVAIVGVACLLPKAQDAEQLWTNLLGKVNAIVEIPVERWDHRLYYDPNPRAEDKINAKWGSFLDEIPFDPLRYGIPPNSLGSICISQLLAVEVTRRALEDAGYGDGNFDRENTSVVFAAGGSADLEQAYMTRSHLPACVVAPAATSLERLPRWSEESYAGILVNVIAGRVANQFDLRGRNFIVDAACGSSLAALDVAVAELVSGRSNVVIAGAAELEQTPHAYLAFSKTRALSPRGQASVFDAKADGIVLGEGVVVLVLKRLADAERDGDRIYSVIQAVAGSSDGKGLGLTAPKSAGQRLAFERAYKLAGIDPATIEVYEAHGTGTAVGDRTELETIATSLVAAHAKPQSCVVGSAKSLLGHTRSAAGMVGVMKMMLALQHRVLPPHAGVESPLGPLVDAKSPVYLLDTPHPWLAGPHPRRAGVSAFGFGGTNFHVVLEEYQGDFQKPALGAEDWPHELFIFEAPDVEALIRQLDELRQILKVARGVASFRDLAFSCAIAASESRSKGARAYLVADGYEHLAGTLEQLIPCLQTGQHDRLPAHVHLALKPFGVEGKVAFLFPGQGSQYPGMAHEIAVYFAEMRAALELGNTSFEGKLAKRLSDFILPRAAYTDVETDRIRDELMATSVAQPAIGVISLGMLDICSRVGLVADLVAGHSYGELSALHAAGALTREAFLHLSGARGRIMQAMASESGAMAAVSLSRDALVAQLRDRPLVTIANHNAPEQCVISGATSDVEEALRSFSAQGIRAFRLPVSAAFHSPLMRHAREPFRAVLDSEPFAVPTIDVYANSTGRSYGRDPSALRGLLAEQLEKPVEFVAQIEQMHEDGARIFVEVGPRTTLTGLVQRILKDRRHVAVALDGAGGGLRGLLGALGALAALGVPLHLRALFADRPVQRLDLRGLSAVRAESQRPGWVIDGGRIRRASDRVGLMGERPLVEYGDAPEVQASEAIQEHPAITTYRDYQSTMRQFLAMQERVTEQMLATLGGGVSAPLAVVTSVVAPEPEVPRQTPHQEQAAPAETSFAMDAPSLRRRLVLLVSQRTGYPEDMLGLDQDMEAQLGIDSIKRIEILEALLRDLAPPLAQRLQSQMDRLSRIKSMNGLVDFVLSVAPPPALARVPEPSSRSCPRFTTQLKPRVLPTSAPINIEGLFLVTADHCGVVGHVVTWLEQRGARPVVIPEALLDKPNVAEMEQTIKAARAAFGPVRGIVHLASLDAGQTTNLVAWKRETARKTKSLFFIARACTEELGAAAKRPMRILALTRLGRRFGATDDASPVAASSGCQGILRCIAREYPEALTTTIAYAMGAAGASPERIAEHVCAELLHVSNDSDVVFLDGHRSVLTVVPAPLAAAEVRAPMQPQAGWVVLITGGARGITAAIARKLANPLVHLIVVGRGETTPRLSWAEGADDVAELRRRALEHARRASQDPSPAAIEAEIREVQRAREREKTLEDLRERGALVEYHALDVRDGMRFQELINDIYRRFGRIDAVVHGAGIIQDQLIGNKTEASFDEVFDTKADSGFILGQTLKAEGLRWVVLFGSVAGRFGNRGQADYAAANETLNQLGLEMCVHFPQTRITSINWGPWRDVGMASEAALRQLAAQAIEPIDVNAGVSFFMDEIERGGEADVEVVAGSGPWDSNNG